MAYANIIAAPDLSRGDQIRQGLDQKALNCTLQVARSISGIDPFCQQEIPGAFSDVDREWSASGSGLNAPLHRIQFNVDNSAQLLIAQRLKHYDLVQTVDELRCKLSTGRRDTDA